LLPALRRVEEAFMALRAYALGRDHRGTTARKKLRRASSIEVSFVPSRPPSRPPNSLR
jgi:hypothetical protein